jgi:hypothetical protein
MNVRDAATGHSKAFSGKDVDLNTKTSTAELQPA